MPNVQFTRQEVSLMLPKWRLIRDCLAGQEAIKNATTDYLPKPNPTDTSDENSVRYRQYVERAVFYNVTQRTHGGLVGQVFRRDPVLECPTEIQALVDNIDGGGVTLDQQGKKALGEVLGYGRCGLFVDFPSVNGAASVADMKAGLIRPTITLYDPWSIINWRVRQVGAKKLLSLVVLCEDYTAEDDGFEMKMRKQWRVLSLGSDGAYRVDLWRGDTSDGLVLSTSFPKDAAGNALTEIPFVFVGSVNNDPALDLPPMYDMAVLNVAHYRNSADYEEACYIVGQPTPYFSGLTKDWVDDVFKKRPIQLGSRAAIPLPEAGKAGLLQATENSMPKEAMELKEKQMISLGAKLVEQSTVQRTATEARQEEASESSILSSCAHNVSAAYTQALQYCWKFLSTETSNILYKLNTDFELSKLGAAEIQQVVLNWKDGAVAFVEMRDTLRKAGYTKLTDEEAMRLIKTEAPLRQPQQKTTQTDTTAQTP